MTLQHTSESKQPSFAAGAAFLAGDFVPIDMARISVLDLGFSRSDATYDVAHVWDGRFFRLDDHLNRFHASCKRLRLHPPYGHVQMLEILLATVRLTGLRKAYVEMLCTRGMRPDSSQDILQCEHQFMGYAVPLVPILSQEQQERGGHLIVSNTVRIPSESFDPRVKNYQWGDMTAALLEARDDGADTAVLVDMDGFIAEGPGFNIFCVVDEVVITPGAAVLEGITRLTVGEICSELGIEFEERGITPKQLKEAAEVFISSTAGGVMSISTVDGEVVGREHPGVITELIKSCYWDMHTRDCYSTPVRYD